MQSQNSSPSISSTIEKPKTGKIVKLSLKKWENCKTFMGKVS